MILAWTNRWDSAALTVGSEIATLPGANVKKPHLVQKWHTAAGVKSSFQVGDLGSSLACAILGVFGTNLTPAATYRVRASNADPNAVASLLLDTGTLAAGVKAGYGAIYKTFTLTTARYWRIDLTDTSVPDNLQIGRIFLGPYWSHQKTMLYGWGVSPIDPSEVNESRGGQSFIDGRPQFRALELALDYLTEAEIYDNPFALARANGTVKDVLAIPFETGAYISEQSVWGRVTSFEQFVHRDSQTFRTKLRIKERL